MNLIGLSIILIGTFANACFVVPKQKAVVPIASEWQCSNCKLHNYEGTKKCYFCGTSRWNSTETKELQKCLSFSNPNAENRLQERNIYPTNGGNTRGIIPLAMLAEICA